MRKRASGMSLPVAGNADAHVKTVENAGLPVRCSMRYVQSVVNPRRFRWNPKPISLSIAANATMRIEEVTKVNMV